MIKVKLRHSKLNNINVSKGMFSVFLSANTVLLWLTKKSHIACQYWGWWFCPVVAEDMVVMLSTCIDKLIIYNTYGLYRSKTSYMERSSLNGVINVQVNKTHVAMWKKSLTFNCRSRSSLQVEMQESLKSRESLAPLSHLGLLDYVLLLSENFKWSKLGTPLTSALSLTAESPVPDQYTRSELEQSLQQHCTWEHQTYILQNT